MCSLPGRRAWWDRMAHIMVSERRDTGEGQDKVQPQSHTLSDLFPPDEPHSIFIFFSIADTPRGVPTLQWTPSSSEPLQSCHRCQGVSRDTFLLFLLLSLTVSRTHICGGGGHDSGHSVTSELALSALLGR